jgi:O-antigen/teichoic acid export membrane protein
MTNKSRILFGYVFQFLQIIVKYFSFVIIIPFLSKDVTIYGLYNYIISFTIVIAYLDFGYLRSANKFCSEEVSSGKIDDEIKILGFSGFMFFLISLFFIFILLGLSFFPSVLISNLKTDEEVVFKSLLRLLTVGILSNVVYRISQVFFEVRFKSYLVNIISTLISIVNIIIAITLNYMFDDFPIVLYYALFNITYFLFFPVIFCFLKNNQFNFLIFLKNFRYNITLDRKLRALSYSNFFQSIFWLFFMELDLLFIGKYFGKIELGIVAPVFSILVLQKFFITTLMQPFTVKLFHESTNFAFLKIIFSDYFSILFSLISFFSIGLFLFSERFILTWLGLDYIETVKIFRITSLFFSLSFFSIIYSTIINSKLNVSEVYFLSFLQTFLFWFCVLVFYLFNILSVFNFYFIKLGVFFIIDIYCIYRLYKFDLFKIKLFRILEFVLIFIVSYYFINSIYFTFDSSFITHDFFQTLVYIGFFVLLTTFVYVRPKVVYNYLKVFVFKSS